MRYDDGVKATNTIRRRFWAFVLICGASFAMSNRALGQPVPPFFGGAITPFDFQIGVIDGGSLLDAQATVLSDQRYVTVTARPDNATVIALKQFRIEAVAASGAAAGGAAGFVGGVNLANQTNQGVSLASPAEIERAGQNAVSVLNRRGVFLLAPLK
jgi:hypothetical protein